MFKVPEQNRITNHPILSSDSSYGNNGAFNIPMSNRSIAFAIVSDGGDWEHVSVHIVVDLKEQRTPTWAEMCKIKDMFWDEEDCVIQYHPAKADYVNNHKHTLHLWKPTKLLIPTPDPIMVGYVGEQK